MKNAGLVVLVILGVMIALAFIVPDGALILAQFFMQILAVVAGVFLAAIIYFGVVKGDK